VVMSDAVQASFGLMPDNFIILSFGLQWQARFCCSVTNGACECCNAR
jgi:hypothetical protein